MGIVAVPFTFSTGTVITASEVNTNNTTIYNEFNGNIDDTNIKAGANINGSKLLDASVTTAKLVNTSITDGKIDYTSAKVVRAGPTFAGSNGVRLARGSKAFTYPNPGNILVTITFSTDCTDGNPAFAATPKVVIQIEHSGGTAQHTVKITSVNATTCTVEVRSSLATDNSSGTLHFLAMGNA